MDTKHLVRKLEIAQELKKLESELATLLRDVLEGALKAAIGDPSAREELPQFTQRLENLQAKVEELTAESQTIDFLVSMNMPASI